MYGYTYTYAYDCIYMYVLLVGKPVLPNTGFRRAVLS